MKVVILAGGLGTRLSEETVLKPKPMVEVGGMPVLWHIMKIYSTFGYNDFIVCLGYKGYMIKEYFANYFLHKSNVTIDLKNNAINVHESEAEDWKITLIDTGSDTMTGGRIKRIKQYTNNEPFLLTYGDGLGNVQIDELVAFHKAHGGLCTVTSAQPSGRFGALGVDENNKVTTFHEKPKGDGAWINAGFFVCEPTVIDYIEGDETTFEREPLEQLASQGQLHTFKHYGFWKPMDTLRDKQELDADYSSGNAKWTIGK